MENEIDLFISHSSDDEDIVLPLIELLLHALDVEPARIRATSIDAYRLPSGIPYEEALRRETQEARAFIGLVSEASLVSTYVAFELGSRWGAGKHLIPVIVPPVLASSLEGPLASLNTVSLSKRTQVLKLLEDLASELGVETLPASQNDRYLLALETALASRSQQPSAADGFDDPTDSAEVLAPGATRRLELETKSRVSQFLSELRALDASDSAESLGETVDRALRDLNGVSSPERPRTARFTEYENTSFLELLWLASRVVETSHRQDVESAIETLREIESLLDALSGDTSGPEAYLVVGRVIQRSENAFDVNGWFGS